MARWTMRLAPNKTSIDFMRLGVVSLIASGVLIFASFVGTVTLSLNFGIDFLGGVLVEVRLAEPTDMSVIRSRFSGANLGEIALQQFGEEDVVLLRVERQEGGENAQQLAVEKIREIFGELAGEYRRIEFVGPTVGAELKQSAILAISLSLLAILVYIWFRFEWQYGLAAVLALAHDVVLTVGLFSFTRLEFNLSTVAAILTIAGYSINDTVVVFDRVREEFRRYRTMDVKGVLNIAINATLGRTLMTSFTTLLAVTALLVLGGPVIRDFSIALFFGVLVGTYSSVFVASVLLLKFNPPRGELQDQSQDQSYGTGSEKKPSAIVSREKSQKKLRQKPEVGPEVKTVKTGSSRKNRKRKGTSTRRAHLLLGSNPRGALWEPAT